MNITEYIDNKRSIVDKALFKELPVPQGPSRRLTEAMCYSVEAGGKRLRPILMIVIAEMLGHCASRVLMAGCAIEYIHTSTLILDDLPCMDDSNFRRGRPSVHKKFGESTAVLASYGLVVLAFELLVKNSKKVSGNVDLAFTLTQYMSEAMGHQGVCAGQYLDLASGAQKINKKALTFIHQHKTADLFVGSCQIAACLCGADKNERAALTRCGTYMGLAFQAYDDMLSLNKSTEQLGKQTKQDKNAPNLVNLFGAQKAQLLVERYVAQAEDQLRIFKDRSSRVRDILRFVIERDK